ncbi:MAG: epoxyqueuosine reductase QueH [Treponema sp.]|jgi:tRNA A37 threonylcarbamoyladenosine dehydratase/predicted adenine nucleotide alpha hydrolase (AANH) superfamily ATPase|nr:epoxyqueuosine reductase QueH [Treponema sp.]
MKLLFHCCCAPCTLSCIDSIRTEGIEAELFWYNPNIHPYTEYKSRRDCLREFAAKENLKLELVDEYGLNSFLAEVFPVIQSGESKKRCEICYRMRLEKTALAAAEKGYRFFSTSLLVSPYQDHDSLKLAGVTAAAKYGVEFFYRDFRPFYREGQTKARTANLYMQKYCGCIFSEEEKGQHAKVSRCPKSKNLTTEDTEFTEKEKEISSELRVPPCPPWFNILPVQSSNESCNNASTFAQFVDRFNRLELLIGNENLKKLQQTKALVFGLGGVGSWAAEALVRCGIGKIGIVDFDVICDSNINRQIEATTLTVGLPKAETLKKRLLEINPDCEITSWDKLFSRQNVREFDIASADYVIDAIDSLNHKLDLIETVLGAGVTLFSSMGMALKIEPSRIKTASVWKTDGCPLARLVRQGLRKRGFSGDFTAVYSNEKLPRATEQTLSGQKPVNGSVVTVTASAGLILANLVIQDAIKLEKSELR